MASALDRSTSRPRRVSVPHSQPDQPLGERLKTIPLRSFSTSSPFVLLNYTLLAARWPSSGHPGLAPEVPREVQPPPVAVDGGRVLILEGLQVLGSCVVTVDRDNRPGGARELGRHPDDPSASCGVLVSEVLDARGSLFQLPASVSGGQHTLPLKLYHQKSPILG